MNPCPLPLSLSLSLALSVSLSLSLSLALSGCRIFWRMGWGGMRSSGRDGRAVPQGLHDDVARGEDVRVAVAAGGGGGGRGDEVLEEAAPGGVRVLSAGARLLDDVG